jgi:hypothetical protein
MMMDVHQRTTRMKELCTYDIGRAVCVETAFVGTNAGAKAAADAARRAAAAIVNFIVVFALVFEVQMVGWLSWHQALEGQQLCRVVTRGSIQNRITF